MLDAVMMTAAQNVHSLRIEFGALIDFSNCSLGARAIAGDRAPDQLVRTLTFLSLSFSLFCSISKKEVLSSENLLFISLSLFSRSLVKCHVRAGLRFLRRLVHLKLVCSTCSRSSLLELGRHTVRSDPIDSKTSNAPHPNTTS